MSATLKPNLLGPSGFQPASSLPSSYTPGMSLVPYVQGGRAKTLQALMDAGADPNIADESGMNALHHAAAFAFRPCIRVLVASGKCNYLAQDKLGRYASDLAIEWGRDGAVARLLTKHQLRQAWNEDVPPFVINMQTSELPRDENAAGPLLESAPAGTSSGRPSTV